MTQSGMISTSIVMSKNAWSLGYLSPTNLINSEYCFASMFYKPTVLTYKIVGVSILTILPSPCGLKLGLDSMVKVGYVTSKILFAGLGAVVSYSST